MNQNKIPSRMLFLIAGHKFAEKAEHLLSEQGIPLQYALSGTGTATSEMMDLLGLGTPEKTVLLTLVPKSLAGEILQQLNDKLQELERKNRGIAFTLPLLGANRVLLRLMGELEESRTPEDDEKEVTPMTDRKYALITAVVNQGYSEEVMTAARAAGARGGTVLHSRQVSREKTPSALGLDVQEEKEMILIVASEEQKTAIMSAISEQYGIRSEAKGLILSLPIDDAIGLS